MSFIEEKSTMHAIKTSPDSFSREVEDAPQPCKPLCTELALDEDEKARRKSLTRKILWKIDCRVIPLLAALYLCCFLDKTNVGNAKILGLTEDLGINPHQYGVALAVFYIPYILCEIPSSLVLKKVSPRIWLAFLGSACGIIGMCISFVQNYAGFVAIRLVLGLFEGGILPAIIVYFSGLYTRGEIALRVGVFYTSTSLSGTFSGLLARGLSAIGPHYPFDAGWRWIMFIEGPLTIMVAVSVCLIIPNNVGSAKFLTPEERDFALQRLHDDVPRWLAADGSPLESEKFQWSEVRRGFRSIQAWLTASAYLCILSGIYSYGIFSPAIIKGLGYTANDAQLWSVIPYAVASVVTVISAVYSDKYRLRGPFMLGTLAIGIIGYAVVGNLNDSQLHVKYGMMMLMATGLYASVPPMIVWLTNNSAGHYKLATCTGLQMSIANLAGFVSSFIYPSYQAPSYFQSHMIIMALLIYAWVAVLLNMLYCAKINRDKASGKYDQYIGYPDDRNPDFKMTL